MIPKARRYGLLGGLVLAFAAATVFGQATEPPVADGRNREPQVSLLLDRLVEELRTRPEDPARWLEYGETLHAHGLVSDAAECYRAALELLPAGDVTRLTARYLLAHALRGADRAVAAEVLEAAVAEHPGYPPSLLFLGELREELGDRTAAEVRYRQALELDPGSALALFRLGSIELAMGETREALALLERALALAPDAGAVRAALARAWNAAGDRDRGRAVLDAGEGRPDAGLPPIEDPVHFRMTERDISSPRLLERARAARGAGRLEDAEILYRDLARIRPRDADVLAELGAVLDQRGRPGEAEPWYRDAVALDPGQALARFGLGVLRAREGNLPAAEYEFREFARVPARRNRRPTPRWATCCSASAASGWRSPRWSGGGNSTWRTDGAGCSPRSRSPSSAASRKHGARSTRRGNAARRRRRDSSTALREKHPEPGR